MTHFIATINIANTGRNSSDSVTLVQPSFVILTIPTLYTLKDYVKLAFISSHRDNPSQDIFAADFERAFIIIQPSEREFSWR